MAAMAIPAAAATPSMTISDFVADSAEMSELCAAEAALLLLAALLPLVLLPLELPLSVVEEVSGFFGGG